MTIADAEKMRAARFNEFKALALRSDSFTSAEEAEYRRLLAEVDSLDAKIAEMQVVRHPTRRTLGAWS